MGARSLTIAALGAVLLQTCAGQTATLGKCLVSSGFPSAYDGTQPWSANIALTVSDRRDAARIFLGEDAIAHRTFLIFSVLPSLTFNQGCVGRQLEFRVFWEPSLDGRHGVSKKGENLVVTSYGVTVGAAARRRHGGPLELTDEDLANLRVTPSINEFLLRKGFRRTH